MEKSSPHEKLIRRDLPRTFPTLDYFKEQDGEGQDMLFNVIKAYSLFDTHVGYCQGLHFVVGVLLLHVSRCSICFESVDLLIIILLIDA